jgi:hypothetical protein
MIGVRGNVSQNHISSLKERLLMGPQFFETIMGKRFIEGTAPKAVAALEKIAAELARLNDNLEKGDVVEFPAELLGIVDDLEENPMPESTKLIDSIPWSDIEVERQDYSCGDSEVFTEVLLRIYNDGSANLKYGNREHFIYSKSREFAMKEAGLFLVRNNIDHMTNPRVCITNPNLNEKE